MSEITVGLSWQSILGRREIVKIDGERVYVGREGTGIKEIMPLSFVPRAMAIDAAKLTEAAPTPVTKAREKYEDFLTETYPNAMRAGKARVSLQRSIQYKGSVMTSARWIEEVMAAGGKVEVAFGEEVIRIGPSTFYAKPQVNGVLLKYARWLTRSLD